VRSLSTVLIAVLCAAASGQQRGGMTGGGQASGGFNHSTPPPLINPVVHRYITSDLTFAQRLAATVSGSNTGLPAFRVSPGQGPFPGWNNMPRFGSGGFSRPSGLDWNGSSAFTNAGFSFVPYPVFGGGPYGPDYYPPQPSPPMPVLPPQFIAESSPPVRIQEPGLGIRTFQVPVGTRESTGWESGLDGPDNFSRSPSGVHNYQPPAREPARRLDHPPIIALKNGWVYTVTNYWMKGKTLHFITTQGDHIQVPLTLLDRLYGQQRQERSADSGVPPVRR